MIDYSIFKRIYYSGDTNLFRGGISSFQIKVRAFFDEKNIEGSLFIFVGKSFKQIKLYYKTDKGTWLTTYRLRRFKDAGFIARRYVSDSIKIRDVVILHSNC